MFPAQVNQNAIPDEMRFHRWGDLGFLRRSIVIALMIAVAVLTTTASVAAASSYQEIVKKTTQLIKNWEGTELSIKYAEIIDKAAEKVGKAPAGVLDGEAILKRIHGAQEQIKAIQFPSVPESAIGTPEDISESPEKRRAALAGGVKWLAEQHAGGKQREEVLSQLRGYLQKVNVAQKLGDYYEAEFLKLAQVDISGTLALDWVEMYGTINPAIDDLVSSLEAKIRELESLILLSKQKFDDAGSFYRLLIDEERRNLTVFSAKKHFQRNGEMGRLENLVSRENEIADETRALNEQLREVQPLSRDASLARRRLDAAERVIANYKSNRQAAYRIRLSTSGYSYCPENNTWEKCTDHPNEKQRWLNDQAEKSRQKVEEIEAEYREAKRNLASLREEMAAAADAYNSQADPIKRQQNELKQERVEIEKSKKLILSKMKSLTDEEKANKALEEGNAADSKRLNELGFQSIPSGRPTSRGGARTETPRPRSLPR
ncbi:MAG: hypothetical protein JNN07_21530 [Verrucomicrobiales bacterium]|nr:hypothetical protein [Verrucomicrobiales bacterium]